jgi:bifunctional DNA-binding transcriptional regulator/antitoxin component of YhaV-PrlF toxin-antitoxin module
MTDRLRVSKSGSIRLPEALREELGWTTGSYLEFKRNGDRLEIWRVEVDLFEEALEKKTDEDAFEKILHRQAESRTRALDNFEEKLKDPPPDLRPEDRPDFWD